MNIDSFAHRHHRPKKFAAVAVDRSPTKLSCPPYGNGTIRMTAACCLRNICVWRMEMKRTMIAAAAATLLGLGLMLPANAMPVGVLSTSANTASDVIQVRGGHRGGHHGMHRGGRGHHYGWSRGRHRGWR
jgi:uncharacterized paraquat-inducible protein A